MMFNTQQPAAAGDRGRRPEPRNEENNDHCSVLGAVALPAAEATAKTPFQSTSRSNGSRY
jgi:hypothetical protein